MATVSPAGNDWTPNGVKSYLAIGKHLHDMKRDVYAIHREAIDYANVTTPQQTTTKITPKDKKSLKLEKSQFAVVSPDGAVGDEVSWHMKTPGSSCKNRYDQIDGDSSDQQPPRDSIIKLNEVDNRQFVQSISEMDESRNDNVLQREKHQAVIDVMSDRIEVLAQQNHEATSKYIEIKNLFENFKQTHLRDMESKDSKIAQYQVDLALQKDQNDLSEKTFGHANAQIQNLEGEISLADLRNRTTIDQLTADKLRLQSTLSKSLDDAEILKSELKSVVQRCDASNTEVASHLRAACVELQAACQRVHNVAASTARDVKNVKPAAIAYFNMTLPDAKSFFGECLAEFRVEIDQLHSMLALHQEAQTARATQEQVMSQLQPVLKDVQDIKSSHDEIRREAALGIERATREVSHSFWNEVAAIKSDIQTAHDVETQRFKFHIAELSNDCEKLTENVTILTAHNHKLQKKLSRRDSEKLELLNLLKSQQSQLERVDEEHREESMSLKQQLEDAESQHSEQLEHLTACLLDKDAVISRLVTDNTSALPSMPRSEIVDVDMTTRVLAPLDQYVKSNGSYRSTREDALLGQVVDLHRQLRENFLVTENLKQDLAMADKSASQQLQQLRSNFETQAASLTADLQQAANATLHGQLSTLQATHKQFASDRAAEIKHLSDEISMLKLSLCTAQNELAVSQAEILRLQQAYVQFTELQSVHTQSKAAGEVQSTELHQLKLSSSDLHANIQSQRDHISSLTKKLSTKRKECSELKSLYKRESENTRTITSDYDVLRARSSHEANRLSDQLADAMHRLEEQFDITTSMSKRNSKLEMEIKQSLAAQQAHVQDMISMKQSLSETTADIGNSQEEYLHEVRLKTDELARCTAALNHLQIRHATQSEELARCYKMLDIATDRAQQDQDDWRLAQEQSEMRVEDSESRTHEINASHMALLQIMEEDEALWKHQDDVFSEQIKEQEYLMRSEELLQAKADVLVEDLDSQGQTLEDSLVVVQALKNKLIASEEKLEIAQLECINLDEAATELRSQLLAQRESVSKELTSALDALQSAHFDELSSSGAFLKSKVEALELQLQDLQEALTLSQSTCKYTQLQQDKLLEQLTQARTELNQIYDENQTLQASHTVLKSQLRLSEGEVESISQELSNLKNLSVLLVNSADSQGSQHHLPSQSREPSASLSIHETVSEQLMQSELEILALRSLNLELSNSNDVLMLQVQEATAKSEHIEHHLVQFTASHDQLQTELASLRVAASNELVIETEYHSVPVDINSMQKRSELVEELSKLTSAKGSLLSDIEALEIKNSELLNKVSEMEIAGLKLVESWQSRQADLEQASQALQANLDEQTIIVSESRDSLSRSNAAVGEVMEQYSDLQTKHEALESVKAALEIRLEESLADLVIAHSSVKSAESQITCLRTEVEEASVAARSENEQMAHKLQILAAAKDAEVFDLHQQLSAGHSDLIDIKQKLQDVITSNSAMHTTVEELSITVQQGDEQLESSHEVLKELQGRCDELSLERDALQQDYSSLQIAHGEAMADQARQTRDLSLLRESIASLEVRCSDAEGAYKSLCVDLDASTVSLEATQLMLSNQTQLYNELEITHNSKLVELASKIDESARASSELQAQLLASVKTLTIERDSLVVNLTRSQDGMAQSTSKAAQDVSALEQQVSSQAGELEALQHQIRANQESSDEELRRLETNRISVELEFSQQLGVASSHRIALESQLASLQHELTEMSEQLTSGATSLTEEFETWKVIKTRELTEVQLELAQVIASKNMLGEQLSLAIAAIESTKSACNEQSDAYCKTLSAKDDRIIDLQTQLEQLTSISSQQAMQLKAEVGDANRSISNLETDLSSLTSVVEQLTCMNVTVQQERDVTAGLLESKDWDYQQLCEELTINEQMLAQEKALIALLQEDVSGVVYSLSLLADIPGIADEEVKSNMMVHHDVLVGSVVQRVQLLDSDLTSCRELISQLQSEARQQEERFVAWSAKSASLHKKEMAKLQHQCVKSIKLLSGQLECQEQTAAGLMRDLQASQSRTSALMQDCKAANMKLLEHDLTISDLRNSQQVADIMNTSKSAELASVEQQIAIKAQSNSEKETKLVRLTEQLMSAASHCMSLQQELDSKSARLLSFNEIMELQDISLSEKDQVIQELEQELSSAQSVVHSLSCVSAPAQDETASAVHSNSSSLATAALAHAPVNASNFDNELTELNEKLAISNALLSEAAKRASDLHEQIILQQQEEEKLRNELLCSSQSYQDQIASIAQDLEDHVAEQDSTIQKILEEEALSWQRKFAAVTSDHAAQNAIANHDLDRLSSELLAESAAHLLTKQLVTEQEASHLQLVSSLQHQFASAIDERTNLATQLASSEAQLEQLVLELRQRCDQCTQLTHALADAVLSRDAMSAAALVRDAELAALKSECDGAAREHDRFKEQLSSKDAQILNLESLQDSITSEFQVLVESEKELTTKLTNIGDFEFELLQSKSDNIKASQQLSGAMEEIEELKISQSQAQLLQQSIIDNLSSLGKLLSSYNHDDISHDSLIIESLDISSADSLSSVIAKLLSEVTSRCSGLKSSHVEAVSDLAACKQELSDAHSVLDQLASDNASKVIVVEQLQAQEQEIQSVVFNLMATLQIDMGTQFSDVIAELQTVTKSCEQLMILHCTSKIEQDLLVPDVAAQTTHTTLQHQQQGRHNHAADVVMSSPRAELSRCLAERSQLMEKMWKLQEEGQRRERDLHKCLRQQDRLRQQVSGLEKSCSSAQVDNSRLSSDLASLHILHDSLKHQLKVFGNSLNCGGGRETEVVCSDQLEQNSSMSSPNSVFNMDEFLTDLHALSRENRHSKRMCVYQKFAMMALRLLLAQKSMTDYRYPLSRDFKF